MLIRPIKIIWYTLLSILALAIGFVVYNYATCPIYKFAPAKPFSGSNIYNPYKDIKAKRLVKANLHAHTKAYGGLTFGENTADELVEIYARYGYDIIGISNYQSIHDSIKGMNTYIPVYEHGYNVFKYHQLSLGAKSVVWRDYPVYAGLSNKQDMINRLKNHCELVVLCHPKFTLMLTEQDVKCLSNYNLMEVVSGMAHSADYWDIALSAGRLSFGIGNDDSHDMTNIYDYSKACTVVYVDSLTTDNVYKSLNSGCAIAAEIIMHPDSLQRMNLSRSVLTDIKSIDFKGDTISIALNTIASTIDFIGQSGEIKHTAKEATAAKYKFKSDDTYIRVEVKAKNGITYYLNPFLRYSDSIDSYRDLNEIDYVKSSIYWVIWLIIIALIGYLIFKKIQKLQRKSDIKRRWYD